METFQEDVEQKVDDCQDTLQEESKNTDTKDGNDCPKEVEENKENEAIINFNEDLLCEHKSLKTADSSRKVIPQEAWSILKKYFPDSNEYPVGSASCSICEVNNSPFLTSGNQLLKVNLSSVSQLRYVRVCRWFSGEDGKCAESEERRQDKGEAAERRAHRLVLRKE